MMHPASKAVTLFDDRVIGHPAFGEGTLHGLGDDGEDLYVPVHFVSETGHVEGVHLAHLFAREYRRRRDRNTRIICQGSVKARAKNSKRKEET